jgi:uncharacterized protein YehS (DUF1456 family)
MDNNDILRRTRYALDFNDSKMVEIFSLGGIKANREEISQWLKKDIDPDYVALPGFQLAAFLNGLIIDNRGKKEGPQPIPEKQLNNNIILRKFKIALNLKDEDILELLKIADFQISKHELSAFFRKPGQEQYRECKDQILRNFMRGMQLKYREGQRAEGREQGAES